MPTARLPLSLYRAEQVRELDRRAIEVHGIPGRTLMERAGAAVFAVLRANWPEARRVGVLCGVGNNGGDGYVVARLAHAAGLEVSAWQVGDDGRQRGDALAAREALSAVGVPPQALDAGRLGQAQVLVDALLGTGLKGPVSGAWAAAVAAANRAGRPVLAVDIPSGLEADTGQAPGGAVQARTTVSFIGLKPGLFTGAGPAYCGSVLFDDLQVPPAVFAGLEPAARRLDLGGFRGDLRPRARDAHKGAFGHVLVVGGELGMSGAARMCAEAAARVGAGLVSVATRSEHAGLLNLGRPELMVHGVEAAAALDPLLGRASVVALGPGLGRGSWSRALCARVLDSGLPLVVDADGLNLLAEAPRARDDWVLTPHPGEAARLLGVSVEAVAADRFAATEALQRRFGGVTVLKGAGTIVIGPAAPAGVCNAGNPGQASGGMGDVLSGVIVGLLAQGLDLQAAAGLGVALHAAAADGAAAGGERGLLAADLMPRLRTLVNPR